MVVDKSDPVPVTAPTLNVNRAMHGSLARATNFVWGARVNFPIHRVLTKFSTRMWTRSMGRQSSDGLVPDEFA